MAQLTQEQINTLKDRGLSDQKIQSIAEQRGLNLPGIGGPAGFATGLAKGVGRTIAGTAGLLQTGGQRVLAGISPSKTFQDIRAETGISALEPETEAGMKLERGLEPRGLAEKAGALTADIATFFVPGAKTTQVTGRALGKVGEKVAGLGVGLSAKEAPLIQAYRARHTVPQRIAASLTGKSLSGKTITNAETALRKNLFGTESMIGIKAKRGADNIWKSIVAPSLRKTKEPVNMPSFINELREQINLIPDPSRRRELERAFKAFDEDHAKFGKVSFERLQKLKEGWAKFLPDKTYRGKPIAGSFREIQNLAAQSARNKIYEKLGPEVRAAYLDYGNMKNLQALGETALTGGKLKGGAGSFITGVYDMAITPIASSLGLTLYKGGRGLEFVGNKGINSVRGIFGI